MSAVEDEVMAVLIKHLPELAEGDMEAAARATACLAVMIGAFLGTAMHRWPKERDSLWRTLQDEIYKTAVAVADLPADVIRGSETLQ